MCNFMHLMARQMARKGTRRRLRVRHRINEIETVPPPLGIGIPRRAFRFLLCGRFREAQDAPARGHALKGVDGSLGCSESVPVQSANRASFPGRYQLPHTVPGRRCGCFVWALLLLDIGTQEEERRD